MSDIRKIKRQYPTPTEAPPIYVYGSPTYCVGGAFCLFYNLTAPYSHGPNFPNEDDLGTNLRAMVPGLSYNEAYDYAIQIINANDQGMFALAWSLLGKALRPRKEIV